ncbi:MAG: hypothetical protein JWL84_3871 [Rhodospirillales bacterium]|jgi:hypothetical protein|nr:hypothetical protein [Rhodospirillales bacterium]
MTLVETLGLVFGTGLVAAVRSDDFRDVANAASLLRRLEDRGIDVGRRWQELAENAERRVADSVLVFARLHYLICLIGAKRPHAAASPRSAMHDGARRGRGTQAGIAASIGVGMADALIEAARQLPHATADRAAGLRRRLGALGGSNVQRDIFRAVLDALAARRRPRNQAPDPAIGPRSAASWTLTAP